MSAYAPAPKPMFGPALLSPWSRTSIGIQLQTMANTPFTIGAATWPVTDKAIYVPFVMERPDTVVKLWWVGTAGGSNTAQVGIYRADYTAVIRGTATTVAGSEVIQEDDIADTYLSAGSYYMGLVCNGTSAQFGRKGPNVHFLKACGVMEQTSARPLPDPMVPVALTSAYLPAFGLAFRTLAA